MSAIIRNGFWNSLSNGLLAAAIAALAAGGEVRGQDVPSKPATFELKVPPEATLYVDNRPLSAASSSAVRTFRTPPLTPTQWHSYEFRVVLTRGDREFSEKQRVYFAAGDTVKRSFLNLLNDADYKMYPRQFQIPTELRIHDLRKQDEVRGFLQRDKSKRVLSDLSPAESASLEVRDALLTQVTEMDPLEIAPGAISDVTYDRMEIDLLKVSVEVRQSSQSYSTKTGRITIREADRYTCMYRQIKGDWMMEKYWSVKGDAIGDALLRWESALAANPAPINSPSTPVAPGVAPGAPVRARALLARTSLLP